MKVLLVNSTPNLINAVEVSLKNIDAEISSMPGYEKALDEITAFDPQIVLINWKKGDDIINLCRRIRRLKHSSYIYILIITSRDKEKDIQNIIDSGADDFIFRPFSPVELRDRIRISKKNIQLEEKVNKSKKKMMKLAKEDPLTNLLNRRALLDEALKEMRRASRESIYISAIMIDIKNFSEIVERVGIQESGVIIQHFSRRLKLLCRPYDKIGRFDLSAFLIFLPDSGISNAEKVAARVLSFFSENAIKIKENSVVLKLNMGISEMDPEDVVTLRESRTDDVLMDDLLMDSLIKRTQKGVAMSIKKGDNNIVKVLDS